MFPYLNIQKKIIYSFLFLTVLVSGVFAVTSYLRIMASMENEIAKHGVEVSKIFGQMVTPYIFESDYVTIIDNADELIKNSDIRAVAIVDIHGKLWLSTRQGQVSVSTTTPFFQNIINNKTIGSRQIGGSGHKSLELVSPITALGEVLYLLEIEISLDDIEKEAAARVFDAMIISLLVSLVAIILGGILARLLLDPLNKLVHGTNEIAKGNFSHRIPVTSEDEIGVLSKSFNVMASNLEKELSARKQVERDLKEQQAHLERTVAARTAELTATNERILEEITEHKKTVLALRKSDERYQWFSEVTIDGIVFHNQDGIYDLNNTFTKIFGYSEQELKGKSFIDIICLPKDTDFTSNNFIETVGVRKDGTPIHIEMLSRVLEDHDSQLFVTSVRNIDDRKSLETRLHRAQRMESIGLIAGGVAHDLNNILTGIVGYPEYVLMELPADSEIRKPLEMIRDSGLKAASLVSDLLTIARGAASVRELSNLNSIIKEYLSSPEHLKILKKYPGISLETDLHRDLWNIHCSQIHVKKSIANLFANAAEAIGESGQIVIATRNEYIDQDLGAKRNLQEGDYVVLSVADSGTGIADEDLEHIFEPFFSTKQMNPTGGTGLGLTVVWTTAEDHQGTVIVEKNEPGTIFQLYFHSTREGLGIDPAAVDLKDLHGNGERLLVVDDDERQRIICGQLLKVLGYAVHVVASGEDALEYLTAHPVDLLVLDMCLGQGINGRQTYSEAKKRIPDLKAIIVSGFSADIEVKETQRLGAGHFVKKPYTLNQIALAIKETFNA